MINILAVITADVPYRLAFKRASHIEYGHPYNKSVRIDKLQSEKHKHTDEEYIYTINVMHCTDCGLEWLDTGLERRDQRWK